MTVTLQEAQTQLEQLGEKVDMGEEIIAVTPPKRPLGTLEGMYNVPDDIKTPFKEEIEEMFYGSDEEDLDIPEPK
jgi:hypothetical protein